MAQEFSGIPNSQDRVIGMWLLAIATVIFGASNAIAICVNRTLFTLRKEQQWDLFYIDIKVVSLSLTLSGNNLHE